MEFELFIAGGYVRDVYTNGNVKEHNQVTENSFCHSEWAS